MATRPMTASDIRHQVVVEELDLSPDASTAVVVRRVIRRASRSITATDRVDLVNSCRRSAFCVRLASMFLATDRPKDRS